MIRILYASVLVGILSGEWEVISHHPRIYVHDNFFSNEECDALISRGNRTLSKTGHSVTSHENNAKRTGSTAFYPKLDQDWSLPLRIRIHNAAKIPLPQGYGLQVRSYNETDFYSFHPDSGPWEHSAMTATFLVFLNDLKKGGETVFPMADKKWRKKSLDNMWKLFNWKPRSFKNYCKNKVDSVVHVKPKKGRALLFYNHDVDGEFNPHSIHGGCPPGEGEKKYIAVQWMGAEKVLPRAVPPVTDIDLSYKVEL